MRGPKSQVGMDWTTHFCGWWWGIRGRTAEPQQSSHLGGTMQGKVTESPLKNNRCTPMRVSIWLPAMVKEAAKRNQQKGQWTSYLWFLATEARGVKPPPGLTMEAFVVTMCWRSEARREVTEKNGRGDHSPPRQPKQLESKVQLELERKESLIQDLRWF